MRLDAAVAARGLARSRSAAADLIAAGDVLVRGEVCRKPARQVTAETAVELANTAAAQYVSRAAGKLLGALAQCPHIDPAGVVCLDAGSSTGGFTQVLLERGAALVHAVDVGTDQLHPSLRAHPAVVVRERTNIRHLAVGDVAPPPSLVVADLSFISLRLVVPVLAAVAESDADWVLMVKPQFEVGKGNLDGRGVVTDPVLRADAVVGVLQAAWKVGLSPVTVCPSPVLGPAGNVEFFVALRRTHEPGEPEDTAEMNRLVVAVVTQTSEAHLS